jgi:hypothetical protein
MSEEEEIRRGMDKGSLAQGYLAFINQKGQNSFREQVSIGPLKCSFLRRVSQALKRSIWTSIAVTLCKYYNLFCYCLPSVGKR